MLGQPLSLRPCLYRQLYLTNYDARGINKIPSVSLLLAIVKHCLKKDHVKHTRLEPSQDQAMADPTANLRQQLTDHEANKDK